MKKLTLILFAIILFSFSDSTESRNDMLTTSFFGSRNIDNRKAGCPLDRNIEYYHNGMFAKPKVGDNIYTNVAGTMPLAEGWYKIAIRKTARVNNSGEVTYIFVCPPEYSLMSE